ncbi:flagellar basal body-associated protein FliL [Amycolatopsis sp. cg5]|uniref:flagellar basal body-associated protein FliL n=1 Tax=Amycolatopsis sp. cg5 TaxID=3238802 RepID=UPI00352494CA
MSWQEELRNLDEELASGRLSADDYRVRRDQVLSSAVAYGDSGQQQAQAPQQPQQQQYQQPQAPQQNQQNQPSQQNPQQPNAESTQIIAPVSPPQGNPSAESTQIVSSADVAPERTQVVNSWQQQQHADPNRTQVVPNSPAGGFQQPHSPAGGFQQPQQYQQQPAWNAPDQDVAPPWGGSDFPPIAPAGSSEWVKQGPEVFEDRTGRGKGGKIAVIVVVALLVLAGLGVGGYFLFKPSGENTEADKTPAPAPTSQNSPPPKPKSPSELLLEKIPNPSGEPDPKNNVLGVGQLVGTSVLEQGEVDLLTAAGVKEVAWKGSQKQPDEFGPQPAKISIMVIPVGSPAGATELLKQLRAYQAANGFTLISEPLPEMPESVALHKKTGDTSGIYRGTWVSGDNVIRVSIDQQFPTDKIEDEKALSGSYQRAVKKTLTPFPAS